MPETNPGTTGLVSWWSLEEASGTRNDSHGTNHLSDSGSVGSGTGIVGTAADLEEASSQYLAITDGAQSGLDITGDMTVVAWAKFESFTSYKPLVTKDASPDRSFGFYYHHDAEKLVGYAKGGGTTGVVQDLTSLSLATWYMFTFRHDATADTISINRNAGTPTSAAHSANINNSGADFRLGANAFDATRFDGLMDEVSVWNVVLTADNESWLYNSGAGRAYAELAAGQPMALRGLFVPGYAGRQWARHGAVN